MKRVIAILTTLMITILTAMPAFAYTNGSTTAKIPVVVDQGGTVKIEAVTSGAPMPASDTIKVKDDETAYFEITYEEPEVFEYKIYQVDGGNKKISFDDTVFDVSVYVVNANEELEPIVLAFDNGEKIESVHFKNKIKMDDPGMSKTVLNGGTWEAETDANNKDIVKFRLASNLPSDWDTYDPFIFWFYDKLPNGLTYLDDAKITFHNGTKAKDITSEMNIEVNGKEIKAKLDDINRLFDTPTNNDSIEMVYSVRVDWSKAGDLKNLAHAVLGDKETNDVHATVHVNQPHKKVTPIQKVIKQIKTGDFRMWLAIAGTLLVLVLGGALVKLNRRRD